MSKIKVKLLNEDCMPERTHRWDAGWDLKSIKDVVIPAGQTIKVHTGVIFEIPPRHFGMVVPRSSLGTKHRVTLANDVGVIDAEYRGEILVFLSNDGDFDYKLSKGDRFAQILILPVNTSELWEVDQVSETGRGSGGFGSTTLPVEPNKDMPLFVDNTWGVDEVFIDEVEFLGNDATNLLCNLTPIEYIMLNKSGKLKETYPDATGDIKIDLGI